MSIMQLGQDDEEIKQLENEGYITVQGDRMERRVYITCEGTKRLQNMGHNF